MKNKYASYIRFSFSDIWFRVPRWLAKKLFMNEMYIDVQLGKQHRS